MSKLLRRRRVRCILIGKRSRREFSVSKPPKCRNCAKIPVFFPVCREFARRDWFATTAASATHCRIPKTSPRGEKAPVFPRVCNWRNLRCLVPHFDGAFLWHESKDALWARFFTGAPRRLRRSVERFSIVKRA